MAAFRYRALDLQGAELAGVVEADTLRQARSQLKAQGLFALALEGVAQARPGPGRRRLRLGHQALTLLTRQWATLLDAGLPIEQSLSALMEQSEDPACRPILAGVRSEILAGHPLHQALARFDDSFPPLYQALVQAGEKSGQLSLVMERLADTLEARHALRQKLIQALIYPLLVVLVATAVIMALMVYVVPQVVGVFQSGHQTLPLLTRALIAVSDFLRLAWPALLLGSLALAWLARRALARPALRRRWHQRLMGLPALGRLLVSVDSARLAQTLAILVGSGVPLLHALEAGRAVLWLMPLQESLEGAIRLVREGVSLHRALARDKRFPPLLLHMIASGEQTGRLDEMLEKVSRQQQEEVGNRLAVAMSLLEPLLILAMGGFVLLIVLAILQPIIAINQLLH